MAFDGLHSSNSSTFTPTPTSLFAAPSFTTSSARCKKRQKSFAPNGERVGDRNDFNHDPICSPFRPLSGYRAPLAKKFERGGVDENREKKRRLKLNKSKTPYSSLPPQCHSPRPHIRSTPIAFPSFKSTLSPEPSNQRLGVSINGFVSTCPPEGSSIRTTGGLHKRQSILSQQTLHTPSPSRTSPPIVFSSTSRGKRKETPDLDLADRCLQDSSLAAVRGILSLNPTLMHQPHNPTSLVQSPTPFICFQAHPRNDLCDAAHVLNSPEYPKLSASRTCPDVIPIVPVNISPENFKKQYFYGPTPRDERFINDRVTFAGYLWIGQSWYSVYRRLPVPPESPGDSSEDSSD